MTILKDKITLPCGAQIKNRICKAAMTERIAFADNYTCLLYTSPSPRDAIPSRMPSSA